MRHLQILTVVLLSALATIAFLVPPELRSASLSIADSVKRSIPGVTSLEKRKGGGGRGSSGGSSSSGSSSGGKGGSSGSTSTTSNTGGRTVSGSGARPAYGGAYGGGGSVPYAAGTRSPKGLLALGLLPVAGIGFLGAAWIASYPYGAYNYYYNQPWRYYNATSNRNESTPVQCLCGRYDTCGCDENYDQAYIKSVIDDGNPAKFNQSLVTVSEGNGTKTIYLNGNLPNGTTASGGDESAAMSGKQITLSTAMLGLLVATAFTTL